MNKLTKISIVGLITTLIVSFSLTGTNVVAFSQNPMQDFYSSNDILFYDPTHVLSCAPANTAQLTGGGTGSSVPLDFSLGNGTPERPVALMTHLMSDYDLEPHQAAGIVGNFMHESGGEDLPPDMNQGMRRGAPNQNFGGGSAYGWAQWDGPRKRNFINWSIQNNYMASASVSATDGANYGFLKHELETVETSTIPAVRQASTVREAVIAFEGNFERAGRPAIDERTRLAERLMGWYGGGGDVSTGTPSSGGDNTACPTESSGGGGSLSGQYGDMAFPLEGGRAAVNNPNMFGNGNTDQGGHPYTAYDILVDPGVPVLAFISGTVTMVSQDRCPGRMISIYNDEHDVVVSYLHLSMNSSSHISMGDTVNAGDRVGVVGSSAEGCGVPHLHIDVVSGSTRVGCSRLNCPQSNARLFVDIGAELYSLWDALPG